MNGIAKQSTLQPVSFEQRNITMTKGQTFMLKLLVDRLKCAKQFTLEDICRCYCVSTWPSGFYVDRGWDMEKQTWYYFKVNWEESGVLKHEYRAKQWFKLNLGACIMKGKLLAIPVIEVE